MSNLFNLIKNEEYDKLINIIKNDNKHDINDYDDTNTYLIQYAILYRQKNIVALLISKGCKLDIIDSDGRSILYIPIKYYYIEIVKILISFSITTIGIPLLEIQDKFLNIPIHYAIMFNRIDIIEEILNSKSNISFKDKNGDTALHMIIKIFKKDNLNILNKIIDSNININYNNNLGYNALHVAVENKNIDIISLLLENNININALTYDNHLTPIFISSTNNDVFICDLLLKNKAQINNQDIYGNTILNIAIMNKFKDLIKLYYDIIDVNKINISGQISINLFFDSNYNITSLDEYYFKEILIKSKINIQNNNGKTLWHYLTLNDIWDKYYNILIQKKNKIFIQDNNFESSFTIIKTKFNNKLDLFLNLIAESYYNYIIANPNYDYSILLDTTNKKKCIKQIIDLISLKNISFPEIKKKFCNIDVEYQNIRFSSYTGAIIDIIVGLLYLQKKYNNISTSLTKQFVNNKNLEDYYILNGYRKGNFDDFLNFEIIWSFQQLFIPTTFNSIIIDFLNDDSKEYLIIPIGIQLTNGSHSNILLYIKSTNELERYEPYGRDYPPNFNYNDINLDTNINNLFLNYLKDIKFNYYSPQLYQPKVGLQLLDSIEYSKEKNIGDPGGFCSAWCLWYIDMRLSYNHIDRNDIINLLITNIRYKHASFRSIIRSFTKKITDIRDEIFNEVGIDINQWLNNNYTDENWNKLVEIIIINIK